MVCLVFDVLVVMILYILCVFGFNVFVWFVCDFCEVV